MAKDAHVLDAIIEEGEHWDLWTFAEVRLMSTDKGKPGVSLGCNASALSLQVRNLAPAQAFPQPPLRLTIGDTVWEKVPDATKVGEQTALNAEYSILDDAMRDKAALKAMREGGAVTIAFQGAAFSYPDIPPAMGKALADSCDRQWQLP